ncbi:conserved hypothetical protein, ribA/ribD-fused [Paenibacillus polysaccharolyticus]|uniref:Uncharacterized protein n=1 Tax=Paenibacillus polysaccharolyticus TaxID=582692 RepID=A0A1G5GSL6_9BACL|nr:NADAR domain-containing protein [Paenibacillus polysaccharolyticus]SCY54401.1 conserved hypothetical protein, ribA/ribD-fused [Paenibacillus polysaccharolyticus]
MKERLYSRRNAIVFKKTNELFGGLSNMAGGYPIFIGEHKILTSEALYQASRFPHMPDVQRQIIRERSPMTGKMRSKPHRKNSRQDWDKVRVQIMRWCLRVKLFQNWAKFSSLLLETGRLPIVEESNKDAFWGAKPEGDMLRGVNCLGRLLMELREELVSLKDDKFVLMPPNIPNFLLYGEEILPIEFTLTKKQEVALESEKVHQLSIFNDDIEDIEEKYDENFPESFNKIKSVMKKMSTENSNYSFEVVEDLIDSKWTKSSIKSLNEYICAEIDFKEFPPTFFHTISDALINTKLKISTKYFLTILLFKVHNKNELYKRYLNTFIKASMVNPNPLGHYFYSLVKKMSSNQSYIFEYKQYFIRNAYSSFLSMLFDEMTQETLMELIEAYIYESNGLLKDFIGVSIETVTDVLRKKVDVNAMKEPFELCYELGIVVIYLELPINIEGFTYKNKTANRGVIVLNVEQNGTYHEKVVLAREIARFLMLDSEINDSVVNHVDKINIEIEQFAGLILIPEGSEKERTLKTITKIHLDLLSLFSELWEIPTSILVLRFIKITSEPINLMIFKNDLLVHQYPSEYWYENNKIKLNGIEKNEITFKIENQLTYKLQYLQT